MQETQRPRLQLVNRVTLTVWLAVFTACMTLSGCGEAQLADVEYVQRAKDYQDKGEWRAAIIELKNALQQNPNNTEARWLLGLFYVQHDQGASAEKEFMRARELGLDADQIRIPLGKSLLLQREFQRVLDEIAPSETTPTQEQAIILRLHGDAERGLGEFEKSCELYQQSRELDAKHIPAYWGLAKCAYAKEDPVETRKLIDAALQLDDTNAESWVILGDFERAEGNRTAAMDAYTTALQHNPESVAALFNRALLFVFTGQLEQAAADIDKLKRLPGAKSAAQFVEATAQYAAGETDQALDSVQQVLQSRPNYLPATLLLALVQYDQKSYEQAVQTLSRYLQRDRWDLNARKLLASALIKTDKPDRALEVLRPYLEADRADAQVLALAGQAYRRRDNAAAAEVAFEKAIELVPLSATLHTELGLSRLAAGREEEAVKALEASSAMDKKDYQADLALAYHYLEKRQFDEALAVIAVLEEKLPENPGNYNLRGQAYMGKNDLAQARASFEKALELQPGLVSAAVRLAAIDVRENDIPAARGRYQAILETDGKNINIAAMVGLAELAALEKNEPGYLEWLERGRNASETALVPRVMLTNYYVSKKEYRKAMSLAREAVAGRPESAEALALLGRVQLAAGEAENAVSTYSQLTVVAPKSAQAQLHLAKAYAAAGNQQETGKALRKALEIDPQQVEGLTMLSALEAHAGRAEEALRLAREVQRLDADSPMGPMLEGDAWMAAKSWEQASQAYQKAMDKGEASALAVRLHRALTRSGKTKAADDALLSWLKAHPQDSAARVYLAQSYAERGLNRQAIEQYEAQLSATPDNPVVLNNLAVVYQDEKDSRALTTAEKAYSLTPDHPVSADTLGWILVQQGNVDRGLSILEKAAEGAPKHPEVRFHLAYALAKAGQTARAREEIEELAEMKLSPDLQGRVHQLRDSLPES